MDQPARKKRVTKVQKEPVQQEPVQPLVQPVATEPVQPKPRKARAKPTKEEIIQNLSDNQNVLKGIIQDLEEDNAKLAGQTFKQLNHLMTETLKNLRKDCQEIEEEIKIRKEEN